MARALRPRRVVKYDVDFKRKAVALSNRPGVLIKDVAESLDIHPNVLSLWRKEARDGLLGDVVEVPEQELPHTELVSLRNVRRELADARKELELIKKLIRFRSQMRALPIHRSGVEPVRRPISVQIL